MLMRSNDINPHIGAEELEATLNGRSGLLGTSGISADLRAVIAEAQRGNQRAVLALEMFVHRIVGAVGWLVGVLGGLDALVFTAGIGENSPLIRERVMDRFRYLGLRLDASANATASADADITEPQSTARALVIAAREDLAILAEMQRLLWPGGVPQS